jgi:hypothetical protein
MRVPAKIGAHAALPGCAAAALVAVQLLPCNNMHAFGMTLMPGVVVPALPAPVIAVV